MMYRAPRAESVGDISFEVQSKLSEIIPLGQGIYDYFTPLELTDILPSLSTEEVFKITQPIAKLAIDHFQDTYNTQPTHINFKVSNANDRKTTAEHWHRDELFPNELLYIVAFDNPTEFAVGTGVPMLTRLPRDIPLNRATKILLKTSKLKIESARQGELIVFGSKHIHRRPAITNDNRVSVSLSIFNRELSLSGAQSAKLKRLQLWWFTRKDTDLYY